MMSTVGHARSSSTSITFFIVLRMRSLGVLLLMSFPPDEQEKTLAAIIFRRRSLGGGGEFGGEGCEAGGPLVADRER